MAVNVHIARVNFVNTDGVGNVLSKDSPTGSISAQLLTEAQHRVLVDTTIANTATQPTVKAYLELEAGDDFVLEYMDQNTIITYERTAAGGFA